VFKVLSRSATSSYHDCWISAFSGTLLFFEQEQKEQFHGFMLDVVSMLE
jgi:hypothetical protein